MKTLHPVRLVAGITLAAAVTLTPAVASAGSSGGPGGPVRGWLHPAVADIPNTVAVADDPTPSDAPPRYVVQADYFYCNSETGMYNWTGSDEPRFDFVSVDGLGQQLVTHRSFGDVDSGETHFFGLLDLTAPAVGPISLSTTLREMDDGTPNESLGHRDLTWSAAELAAALPDVGSSTTERLPAFNGDDGTYTLYLRVVRVS